MDLMFILIDDNITGGAVWGATPRWSIERSCDALLASFGFRRTVLRRWGALPPLFPTPVSYVLVL